METRLPTDEAKRKLRRKKLLERKELSETYRETASQKIAEKVLSLPELAGIDQIFLYASYRQEVDTYFLIEELIRRGKKVCCPKVKGNEMDFYRITGKNDLTEGYKQIPEPQKDCPVCLQEEGRILMLLPGACFDRQGGRIGYGGGYYDRYLGRFAKEQFILYGLAFSCQIINETIPLEETDVRIDGIITEKESCIWN